MPTTNRFREALKENYNTIGLAAAVALSAALLNPLPLLVGAVAEVAYLLIVPDSKWYTARLSKRFDAEVEARRRKLKEQCFPSLRPEMQERFARLEDMRQQIDMQAQDDKSWFREVLRKLDYLLEKFLVFAGKEAQFRSYLVMLRDEMRGEPQRHSPTERGGSSLRPRNRGAEEVPPRPTRSADSERDALPADPDDRWMQMAVAEIKAHYAQERERIQQALEEDPDQDTRSVLEKRSDVLERRQEFAGKIGKIVGNIHHQLQLVEDTFGLINDEIRARSPDQILADIEEVVIATDTMATTLEELAPYERMIARVSS